MSKKQLLIVDDQPHVLRVIKMSLEKKGYAVDMANNGKIALGRLREKSYDVMITDIQMPVMDGQELVETMHKELEGEKPFTFVNTAKADETLRTWAATFPNTELIEKPISLRRLMDRLAIIFS
ncbi:MAG: response regulator [Magnetococcales bacterium]|nr:response regulator [Magnetococcales bacterium]